jgi:ribonuclease HII
VRGKLSNFQPKSPRNKFQLVKPNSAFISQLRALGYRRIVGVDEVGRGALAGPLIVAAVELTATIAKVTDSKLLLSNERAKLSHLILKQAEQANLGEASVKEINELGLVKALHLAYQRALGKIEADLILTDYFQLPSHKFISSIAGDSLFYPVAAASIIAKVRRDNLMKSLAIDFPKYRWQFNVGYGTLFHRRTILELGLTEHHRVKFCQDLSP